MAEIQYSDQLVAEFFDAQPQAVIWFMPIRSDEDDQQIIDFEYGYFNKEAMNYLRASREQLTGLRISTSPFLDSQAKKQVFDLCKRVIQSGKQLNEHFYNAVLQKHVKILWSRIQGGVLTIIQDRTEEYKLIAQLKEKTKQLEEQQAFIKGSQLQLEKSLEELKRTNANLEEFTYAASHDLKEPIRKIRTFADRLKNGLQSKLSEKEMYWFSRMENATDRMKLLVDDLLTYSHVNLGPGLAEEIDLNKKVSLVLGDLELLVEEKGANITVGDLPTIKGYRRQIKQLFHNLISNALKYGKPDVPPEINISCRTILGWDTGLNMSADELNKAYYLIEVADNGLGFQQKDAERIFNVFQRLHGDAEIRGTGVGLSIARKVAENHDGYLTAKGKPGQGATFQILLPVSS